MQDTAVCGLSQSPGTDLFETTLQAPRRCKMDSSTRPVGMDSSHNQAVNGPERPEVASLCDYINRYFVQELLVSSVCVRRKSQGSLT